MGILQQVFIFLIGINIILAKKRYYDYEPYKSFQVPWAWRYPQPIISVEGIWPYETPPGIYEYHPPQEKYPYFEESYYNQEILITSLNNALIKLNQLLPVNTQETLTYPSTTKPEILVEALNSAIDRLRIYLNQQSVTENVATTSEIPIPITTPINVISESVSSAIEDLNKLFTSLPEELLNKKPTVENKNNKPNVIQPSPFVSPILSSELKPNPLILKETTTPGHLFTSHIDQRIKENSDVKSETSKPFLSAESVPNVFTSYVTTETNIESSASPTEINTETTEEIKNSITTTDFSETTTLKDDSSEIPEIDVRFGDQESDIVFPDEFEQLSQNKKQSQQLGTRFETIKPILRPNKLTTFAQPSTNFNNINSPQIILEYKPSRPPFHPDVYPPHPTPRPTSNIETNDRDNPTTVSSQKQIVLEYKPSRPPFHPDVYPPHPTPRPTTQSQTFTPTTITNFNDISNPQTILEYKPSRPPFHPDVYPPHPTPRPTSNIGTNDRTTVSSQTPIVLEYKPSRPPFHPDVYPPHPTSFPDLSNRNKISESSTEKTTTIANQYHPTHYYSTPISLEYKPTRPFYAPDPIVYPKPMIPPGTPWPAFSTEKPTN